MSENHIDELSPAELIELCRANGWSISDHDRQLVMALPDTDRFTKFWSEGIVGGSTHLDFTNPHTGTLIQIKASNGAAQINIAGREDAAAMYEDPADTSPSV